MCFLKPRSSCNHTPSSLANRTLPMPVRSASSCNHTPSSLANRTLPMPVRSAVVNNFWHLVGGTLVSLFWSCLLVIYYPYYIMNYSISTNRETRFLDLHRYNTDRRWRSEVSNCRVTCCHTLQGKVDSSVVMYCFVSLVLWRASKKKRMQ